MKKQHTHRALAIALALSGLGLAACSQQAARSDAEPVHASLQDASFWSYATDSYGSTATIGDSLIENGVASIAFERVARPSPEQNSWIELIHQLPDGSLEGVKSVRLTYKSSVPLLVKLSQKDYGGDGDGSYAHYQAQLPAAADWATQTVVWSDFSRPYWTPAQSKDVGLIPANISAIYLVPDLPDETGGKATLEVKALELEK